METRKFDVVIINQSLNWEVIIFDGSKEVARKHSHRLRYALAEAFEELGFDKDK